MLQLITTSDLMAAQAALQLGTMMLVEARKEWENLKEAQQSNKKTESQMNIDSDFYYSISLYCAINGIVCLSLVLSLRFVKMPIVNIIE